MPTVQYLQNTISLFYGTTEDTYQRRKQLKAYTLINSWIYYRQCVKLELLLYVKSRLRTTN